MKPILLVAHFAALLLVPAAHAANPPSDATQFWPQWRGPLATGVAPLADPPTTWSETEHIKWKVKVPGSGDSTPVVWGDRVFLLTAIPTGKKTETKSPETPVPAADSSGSREGRPPRGRMNSENPAE